MPDWYELADDTRRFLTDRTAFGAWILETRRRLACSQAGLGAMVGLHQSTISRLERGLLPYLRFGTALRLFVVILDACAVGRPGEPRAPGWLGRM